MAVPHSYCSHAGSGILKETAKMESFDSGLVSSLSGLQLKKMLVDAKVSMTGWGH